MDDFVSIFIYFILFLNHSKSNENIYKLLNVKIIIFFCIFQLAISKEEAEDVAIRGPLPYNGFSEEFLDRLERNGNIPGDKDRRYGECKFPRL